MPSGPTLGSRIRSPTSRIHPLALWPNDLKQGIRADGSFTPRSEPAPLHLQSEQDLTPLRTWSTPIEPAAWSPAPSLLGKSFACSWGLHSDLPFVVSETQEFDSGPGPTRQLQEQSAPQFHARPSFRHRNNVLRSAARRSLVRSIGRLFLGPATGD